MDDRQLKAPELATNPILEVQGIILQVELHSNDTRKKHRKKLRRQQYDNSQSQRYEENQEGDSAESDSDEQRQAMLEYELQSTTDVVDVCLEEFPNATRVDACQEEYLKLVNVCLFNAEVAVSLKFTPRLGSSLSA
ncbi:hypothetical protein RHMOL_Rhmol11G0072400 [Rhododendron molle]|uniref:Uncharacterized protein n=1 Tax=Rhododendron molle TaxID=49168 RepID=A0ACC0LQJ6_RHOML|nr:hypothetical protein RHMOL_Rhmol11G0072400 [Rhododendron molle]